MVKNFKDDYTNNKQCGLIFPCKLFILLYHYIINVLTFKVYSL